MLFFKSKDISITNSVKPNTVYRRKVHGYSVFVCGISRPKPQAYVDKYMGMKNTCVLTNSEGDINKFDSYVNNAIKNASKNEYIHVKRDCSSVIVMYKTTSPHRDQVQFLPVSKFLELYELVVGYKENGDMITNSMLDTLKI